jgi:hypothetical protein
VEAHSAQVTLQAFAARAAPVVGIAAGELAAELTQVLAECRAAGAVSYEETLRYLADQGRRPPEELHREAEALRKAMG